MNLPAKDISKRGLLQWGKVYFSKWELVILT